MTPEAYTKKKRAIYSKKYYLDHIEAQRDYATVKNRAKAELKLNALREILFVKFRSDLSKKGFFERNLDKVSCTWKNQDDYFEAVHNLVNTSISVLRPQKTTPTGDKE